MSIVRYNGVTLPYANITQFRQEALYDELGMTDWFLTKFDVRVVCTVNAAYLGMIFPDLVGGASNAALAMAAVRTTLLEPRKALSITFNDYQLMPDVQGTNRGTVDAMNGPKPQSCTVTQLNNVTFLVDYHIIAHYWENNSVDAELDPPVQNFNGNNVLYNRWTEVQELDGCQFSRYTRDGKFVIRSDNKDGFTADQVRQQMAVVGIRTGFLRKKSKYTVSPDGLGLQYQVTDEEFFRSPPAPAFEADGEYTETLTRGQAMRFGECRVVLRGDKTTNQTTLINRAVSVASSKLFRRAFDLQTNVGLLENGFVRFNLYKNEVECVLRVMFAANTSRTQQIASFVGMNTNVQLSNSRYKPNYLLHGTGNFLLQAAAYYDPSLTNTTIDPVSNQLTTGLAPGQAGRSSEE